MGAPKSRTWVWQFDRPVADIWPVMSDTARFNEAAELPKHQIEEIPQTDGSVLYLASGRFGPVRLEWAEKTRQLGARAMVRALSLLYQRPPRVSLCADAVDSGRLGLPL